MASKSLDDLVKEVYDKEGLTFESIVESKGFISTNNLALDFILGGGIARGRTAELYGPSQSGKTTTAAQAAAWCMSRGERVVYLDFEQALDTEYLLSLGVDVYDRSVFIPYPAASLEDGMEFASQMVLSGEVALCIFDSVAAMTPRKIVEENTESRTTAMERARLLGNGLSKLNPYLARTGTAAVFINHERDVIEMAPARPGMPKRTTTPGGTALKYYSSQRLQFQIGKQFKGERVDPLSGAKIDETHSILTYAKVTKNKLAKPQQRAELYLVLGEGFSDAHAAIKVLEASKIVKKTSSFYYFPEDLYHPNMTSGDKGPMIQGLASILAVANGDPEWGLKLSNRARAELNMSAMDLKAKLVDDPEGDGSPVEISETVDPDEIVVTEADVAEEKSASVRSALSPHLASARRLV